MFQKILNYIGKGIFYIPVFLIGAIAIIFIAPIVFIARLIFAIVIIFFTFSVKIFTNKKK